MEIRNGSKEGGASSSKERGREDTEGERSNPSKNITKCTADGKNRGQKRGATKRKNLLERKGKAKAR